jgi:hypothetical protein
VYFNSKKILLEWFSGGTDETIYFIHIDLKITKEVKDFFKCLNVDENLKIIEGKDPLLSEWNYKDSRYNERINGFNPNITINGLENSLENINKSRSTFLWQFLLTNNPNKLCGQTRRRRVLNVDFNIGEIEDSKILKLLKENYWLYNKESILIEKPLSEILLKDLNDDYNKSHDNIEKLIKILGFKLDKVAVFEEETGLKVVNKEKFDEFEKWKKEQLNGSDEVTDESGWTPDVSPECTYTIVDEAELGELKTEDLSGQSTTTAGTNEYNKRNNINLENNSNDLITPYDFKAIGDWGESIANKYLLKKYPKNDVQWLNKDGCIGKGYDFVIKNNGKDIAYYEVKSKTDESPKLFQISGTQWNWAKELHNTNKGEMYRILLISNAGKKETKIKEINNPVSLWKSGKLYAEPVNIQL